MARKNAGDLMVITGDEEGSVYPISREEVHRGLLVDGTRSPVNIHGSVYGSTVRVKGSGTVHGPVFASESLTVQTVDQSRIFLRGGLISPGGIATDLDGTTSVFTSPATTVDGIRIVIRGDVSSAKRVDLRNALVFGSVTAPEIRLQNCIVLGAVVADKAPGHVHVICSTIGLYRTRHIVMEGPTTFTVAGGSSLEEPEFIEHWVEGRPVLPHAMRLLGLCRLENVGCANWNETLLNPVDSPALAQAPEFGARLPGLTCAFWMLGGCPHKGISVVPADFVLMRIEENEEGRRISLTAHKPDGGAANLDAQRWVLQVQARAMNLGRLELAESMYRDVIHRIFAEDHIGDEETPLRQQNVWKELSSHEQRLFGMALRDTSAS